MSSGNGHEEGEEHCLFCLILSTLRTIPDMESLQMIDEDVLRVGIDGKCWILCAEV